MNPLQPGTHKHPTGQALNIKLAFGENKRLWRNSARRIARVVARLPHTKETVPTNEAPKVRKDEKRTLMLTNMEHASKWFAANAEFEVSPELLREELAIFTNATRYDYQVSSALMDRTMDAINQILTDDLLSGSDFWTTRFWLNSHIAESVTDGTLESLESAVLITQGTPVESKIAILDAQQQLASPVYQDRLRLVYGRTFELMKGLTSDMRSQLRMTLTEGVARGVGIRDLTGMINKRLSVGLVRAERIARTEINKAYRDAYMDESDELNKTALKDDPWEIRQVHRSALSPTTRPNHAARHGTIHTASAQRDWWATGSRSINCLCSTLDVLVNRKTGEVLQQKLVNRMLKQKKEWWPSG